VILLRSRGSQDGDNNKVVIAHGLTALVWGWAALLLGGLMSRDISSLLPDLDTSWMTYGRILPLYTLAVSSAFSGNLVLCGMFFLVQRACGARLYGRWAPWLVFWGFNLLITIVAAGYVHGVTQGRDYSEPAWYTDIWMTIVWIVFMVVYFGTMMHSTASFSRAVLAWIFFPVIVITGVLHLANYVAIPVSLTGTKSYAVYAGVQDAMTQWWYGHHWPKW
jgi:cytochrome c oxidase cbb3-type subunit 1